MSERSDILEAVEENDVELVEALILSGAQITPSLLAVAASAGSSSILGLLLQDGTSRDVTTSPERSALVQAAEGGHLDCVRQLMAAGLEAHRVWAVSRAIRAGHLHIIQELIRLPEDANAESKDRNTNLLGLAVDSNHLHIVQYLLSACPGQMQFGMQQRWTSPLSRAASLPEPDVLRTLVTAGADLMTTNSLGNTPLMVACYNNRTANAMYLANRMSGEDLDWINDGGMSALHYAIYNGNVEIVEKLLRRGVDPNQGYKGTLTPLHIAISLEKTQVAILLIEEGADLESSDDNGSTPLDLAIYHRNITLMERLRQEGAEATNLQNIRAPAASASGPEIKSSTADAHVIQGAAHKTFQSRERIVPQRNEQAAIIPSISSLSIRDIRSVGLIDIGSGSELDPLLELSSEEQWSSQADLNAGISDCETIVAALGPTDAVQDGVYGKLLRRILQRYEAAPRIETLLLWQAHAAEVLKIDGLRPRFAMAVRLFDLQAWYCRHNATALTVADYDAAIASTRHALEGLPSSKTRIQILVLLGFFCRKRFDMDKDSFPALRDNIALLEAEELRNKIRSATADSSDDTTYASEFLAFLLCDLNKRDHDRTSSLRSLDFAISHSRNLVYGDPDCWNQYPGRLRTLNELLVEQYHLIGSTPALEEAITLQRAFLDIVKGNKVNGAIAMNNLAHDLFLLHDHNPSSQILDEAYDLANKAIDAMSQQDGQGAIFLQSEMRTNLSNILHTRFKKTGSEEDLGGSISQIEQALMVVDLPVDTRVTRLLNLVGLLRDKYKRSGNSENLEQALNKATNAVGANDCSREILVQSLDFYCQVLHEWLYRKPSNWPCLRPKYDHLVRIGKIVLGCRKGRAARSRALHNLASYLSSRSKRFSVKADIQQAILFETSALLRYPSAVELRAMYLSTMADHFGQLHTFTGQIDLINIAIKFSKAATRLTPNNPTALHNLAAVTMRKWHADPSPEDLRLVTNRFEDILNMNTAPLLSRIRGGSSAAIFAMVEEDYHRATFLLDTVLELFGKIYGPLRLLEDYQFALKTLLNLPERIMSAFLAARRRPEEALERAETARGAFARFIASQQGDVLRQYQADSHSSARARDLSLTGTQRSTDSLQIEMSTAELANNLLPESFRTADLVQNLADAQSAATSSPIVDFAVTNSRKDAIIITSQGVTSISLPYLTDHDLEDATALLSGEARITKKSAREDHTGRNRKLQKLLLWLWRVAVQPVFEHLKGVASWNALQPSCRYIRWVSSSKVGALPLHAAGDNHLGSGNNTMDLAISFFIPNLRALKLERRTIKASLEYKASQGLFIGTPDSIGSWPGLDVQQEKNAFERFCREPLVLLHPTAKRALEELSKAAVCHFACHCTVDPLNPGNSKLVLGNEHEDSLTIADIVKSQAQSSQMVYLAACSTAENASENLVTEGLHMAGAFIMIGFPNVVASLWDADSAAASSIAEQFYSCLGQDPKSLLTASRVAESLHKAVLWYRSRHSDAVLHCANAVCYCV